MEGEVSGGKKSAFGIKNGTTSSFDSPLSTFAKFQRPMK